MFYSQLILARKGPLGKIWLAAHYDKKLTKAQIFLTDITESVESIINPSVPLALRVSGHLMLGIVRIYSKKVKYLVTDCTEAMWKIKMAFRPGSVDLVEAPGTAHLAIDDPRFFGNIDPDIDFPDLEDVAFSQHTLSTYAQRRATLAPEHHTVLADSEFSSRILARRDEPSLDIPDVIPGEEFFRPRASEASKRSRISEIEVMRGRASSISAIHPRPSFASDSSQAARGRFDDDIPAFEELGQDEMMAFGEDAPPPMDAEYYGEIGYIPEMEGTPPGEENQQPAAAGLVLDDSVVFGIRRGTGTKGGRLAEDLAEEEEKKTEGAVQKKKKPLKRGIKPDSTIEYSSHEVKKLMQDMSSTLRRTKLNTLPPKPAPSLHLADWVNPRPAKTDLCGELQDMFLLTMTTRSLPFTYKDNEAARQYRAKHKDTLGVAAGATNFGGGEPEPPQPEAEATRLAADKGAGARRRTASLLGTSAAAAGGQRGAGKEEEEEALPTDDQAMQIGQEYGGDMGIDYYGGGDEYPLGMEPIPEEGEELYHPADEDHRQYDQLQAEEPLLGDVLRQQRHQQQQRRGGLGEGAFAKVDWLSAETPADVDLELEEEDVDFSLVANRATAPGAGGRTKMGEWSPRTAAVMSLLKEQLQSKEDLSFAELSANAPKRKVIACFAEILQLKTFGYIDCAQSRPFADIHITATDKMWGQ